MTNPPSPPRTRNPAQTRTRLLQATIRLVAEKGDEALSLKEAAQLAGLSRTAAYQHFADREDLLREAKSWLSDRLITAIGALEPASLEQQVEQVARLVLENQEASRLLISGALAGRDLGADHPLHQVVLVSLERLRASGDARADIDVETLSFIMLGTVATLLMMSRTQPGDPPAAVARRFSLEWTNILRKGVFDKNRS